MSRRPPLLGCGGIGVIAFGGIPVADAELEPVVLVRVVYNTELESVVLVKVATDTELELVVLVRVTDTELELVVLVRVTDTVPLVSVWSSLQYSR